MMSHDACTSWTSQVLTEVSLKRLNMKALIPAPADCEVWCVIQFFNILYIWGFRARQHLRSLAPVMNDDWWWPNDIRGSKASRHLSYRWGKTPKKNLTQETWPDRGSNPGPLRDRRTCYHLGHSSRLQFLNAQNIAPIEIHRQVCQVYGHTQLDGQHISCWRSAGRCLIIIHPIARTSRPVIYIFTFERH